jgi:hypothetical protein
MPGATRGSVSSLAVIPLRYNFTSNHYGHPGLVVRHQNQKGAHEGIAPAAECEPVLYCQNELLSWF